MVVREGGWPPAPCGSAACRQRGCGAVGWMGARPVACVPPPTEADPMPNIAQTPYAAPVSGHPPLSPACRCVIPILLVSQASMRSTPSAVTMARRRSRSSTASTPSRGSPRSLRREPGCAMQANIRWVLCCGSSLEQKAVCARCVSPVTLGALKVRFTVCVEPCTTKTKLHGRRGGDGGGTGEPGRTAACGRGVLGAFPLRLWSPWAWPMLLAGRPGRTRAHVPGIYRIERARARIETER